MSPFGMAIVVPTLELFANEFQSSYSTIQFIISAYLFGLAFADRLDPTKTRFIKTKNAYLSLGATKFTPEVANLMTVSGFSALALVEHDLKMPIIIDLHHFVPLAKFKDKSSSKSPMQGKWLYMLEKKSGGWIGPFNHKELELTNE